ncbi:prokaryotic phospholipase A2-domain-containing protein [Geopyxis carbonaria]|nr:prokaryotic phospholipase A2-domain-containing protein [Geopyxis carbonaria]
MKLSALILLPVLSSIVCSTPLPAAEALPAAAPIADISLKPRQTPSEATMRAETDQLLYRTPIAVFQAALNSRTPPYLFWPSPTANACTNAPDHPWGFNFKKACQRHDFGYKNHRNQQRFCPTERARIDSLFAKDLADYCSGRPWLKRWACRNTAAPYVAGVRVNSPPYSAECPKPGGGIAGTGRDALGRCIKGQRCI